MKGTSAFAFIIKTVVILGLNFLEETEKDRSWKANNCLPCLCLYGVYSTLSSSQNTELCKQKAIQV